MVCYTLKKEKENRMNLETCQNLSLIIEKDQTIEVIEIWAKVLYIRRSKGRNSFYSKKGITKETEGIFCNNLKVSENYKSLFKKYHPDLNKGKESYVDISKNINRWKNLLLESGQREFDQQLYTELIEFCGPLTSIFTIGTRASFIAKQTCGSINIPQFSSEQEFVEWKAAPKQVASRQAFLDSQLTRAQIIKKYGKSYYDYERDLPF